MVSYEVSTVSIWGNIDHVITAPHCIGNNNDLYMDGSVQDCSNATSALAMELLQSCAEPFL